MDSLYIIGVGRHCQIFNTTLLKLFSCVCICVCARVQTCVHVCSIYYVVQLSGIVFQWDQVQDF